MKIFSDIVSNLNQYGESHNLFVLYLDTQKTGDMDKDIFHCANDFSPYQDEENPEKILELLTPMLAELVYAAYGDDSRKTPLTEYSTTGFDKNYPNGVKY